MELITTMATLDRQLGIFGFSEELQQELAEYCAFLRHREDLLQLAQQYHDDIFENDRYSLADVEQLPERDGREQGMLFAVMYLARCLRMEEVLGKRGIPASYAAGAILTCKAQLEKNKEYYGCYGYKGAYRYRLVGYLMPSQLIIGRLCFQMTTFGGPYHVYRSRRNGTVIPVALPGYAYLPNGKRASKEETGTVFAPTLEEGTVIRGYTFDEEGVLLFDPVELDGGEYEKVLQTGDPVLSIHIPKNGKLSEASVEDAFAQAEMFFKNYYPEKSFAAYICSSWLLDTGLKTILKPESNILKFQPRFRIVLGGVNVFSLYWHIFDMQQFRPLTELKPQNPFQQTMLEYVKKGNSLYSGYGFILR